MHPRTWNLATKTTVMLIAIISVLGVVFVGATSLIMESDAHERAAERQSTNLKVAWDLLHRYGATMQVVDGKLYAGKTSLNGLDEVVDRLKGLVGGTATIFQGDKRIATNVVKPDGSRATGTLLAPGPIYDSVLKRGQSYRGEADILGKTYFTAYDPIFDANRAVIGILYVGIPTADFLASVDAAKVKLAAATLIAGLVFGFAGVLFTRRLFAPLKGITAGMQALQAGDAAVPMPWAVRGDDIGRMAQAVGAFQIAAVEAKRTEHESGRQRQMVEDERRTSEAERAAVAERQVQVVETLAASLARLSSGDMLCRIEDGFAPEYEKLRNDFNDAMVTLQETLRVVSSNASTIRSGTNEISTASNDLARRTEQQAASLEQTAAALDEITTTVRKTSEGASHAREIVAAARAEAEQSGVVVKQAVEAMSAIETSSKHIVEIIGVIDEIAFQTSLLALNAGVEAARAGDAGRGFAVVASEVRALAQRSAEAAKQIKTLISASSLQVADGVKLVGKTGVALTHFVTQVNDISVVVATIAASAKEQATALEEVNIAINQMDQATQQNAAMVEESTAASHALAQEADDLARLMKRFRMERDTADRAVAARPSVPLARAPRGAAVRTARGNGAPTMAASESWQEF